MYCCAKGARRGEKPRNGPIRPLSPFVSLELPGKRPVSRGFSGVSHAETVSTDETERRQCGKVDCAACVNSGAMYREVVALPFDRLLDGWLWLWRRQVACLYLVLEADPFMTSIAERLIGGVTAAAK